MAVDRLVFGPNAPLCISGRCHVSSSIASWRNPIVMRVRMVILIISHDDDDDDDDDHHILDDDDDDGGDNDHRNVC